MVRNELRSYGYPYFSLHKEPRSYYIRVSQPQNSRKRKKTYIHITICITYIYRCVYIYNILSDIPDLANKCRHVYNRQLGVNQQVQGYDRYVIGEIQYKTMT